MALAVIAALALLVLFLRLQQGPVTLPGVNQLIADSVNAEADGAVVAIGDVVLSLDKDGGNPGVQMLDVDVSNRFGRKLFSIPQLRLALDVEELTRGRFHPKEVAIEAPDAILKRTKFGVLRLFLGQGIGVALATDVGDGSQEGEDDFFERALAVLSGEAEGPAALASLERLKISGARLTYDDVLNGARWATEDAQIEVVRGAEGVRATISVAVIGDGSAGAAVQLVAEHKRGAEFSTLEARFGRIRTSVISGQLPALEWLKVLEGTVEGRAVAEINPDASVRTLNGVLIAEDGAIQGLGPTAGFEIAEVNFAVDPIRETIALERMRLSTNGIDTTVSGIAELRRDAKGEVLGLAGQLDVGDLYVRLPEIFSDELSFDDGQINFRWSLTQNRIEVVDTRLATDNGAFILDGRVQMGGDEVWTTDLRAEAVNMTVGDLLDHWPIAAATSARDWIAENIPEADLDRFLAQMRFGVGEPQLTLDFDYSSLTSTYIAGMPPITDARGRGHMTYHSLFLEMDEGYVTPPGGQPIALGGSDVVIRNFWGEVTPADIDLVADGRAVDVLSLIDQKPLRLVSKLGLPLGSIKGRASVRTALSFPLISDLLVEDVQADADAVLRDLSAPISLPGQPTLAVRARRLDLQADTQGMGLRGNASVNGTPITLDWREVYGTTPGRRSLRLSGRLSDELLALAGASELSFLVGAPVDVSVSQRGANPFRFTLGADLTPVRMELPQAGWSKAVGRSGKLSASGSLGQGVVIDNLDLTAGGLAVAGSLNVSDQGDIEAASFTRLKIPGFADVSGSVRRDAAGVLDVRLMSGTLNLSNQFLDDAEDRGVGPPVRVTFDIDALQVTDDVTLMSPKGTFERRENGAVLGTLNANVGSNAPIAVGLDLPVTGAGRLSLTSPDAGRVLEALGLYSGGRGGKLSLDTQIGGDGSAPDAAGRIRIEDIVVRSQSTFRNVLRDGGLSDQEAEVSSGGIRFRKVWVPFVYNDGVITLTDAIASSPALALKLNGTVNEKTEVIDLVGVLSPAYVVTGALDEIPVIGRLLSGGRGEGILAMTFSLSGALDDPDLSVNPLSLLAPGFLRGIFKGRSSEPEGRFFDRVNEARER